MGRVQKARPILIRSTPVGRGHTPADKNTAPIGGSMPPPYMIVTESEVSS